MELKLLEDFVCLSDVRNFSRAAQMRNITQSTLSKRIRSLEHWVGAPLIDRSSYPVQLTTEGRVMIRQARDLVQQFTNLRSCIRGVSEQPRDQVNILAMHTLRVTFLPDWKVAIEAEIGKFAEAPIPANAAYCDTIRMFNNGESDLLLTYVHPAVTMGLDPRDLDRITLGTERILPVSAPNADGRPLHNLDSGDVVRFLSYGTQSFFAQVLAPLLREKLVAMNVVAANAMSVGLHSLALVGAGLAWIPESLVAEDLRSGRLVLAGKQDWILEAEIAMYRKKGNHRPIEGRIWDAAERLAGASLHRQLANGPVAPARFSAARD
ncbi:LysR family transcriptional regulator [Salipiger mangrovisoli]|uniref:LysR family transcriptional regulator n=1 Tax=Salipiger mangrovisoli TaxID=2865933 RepID=A0ABR9X302_9RHOB|nr:LysR family transcriptional regulator [Salipiger mangrovisoli]MBE9637963.1 LysR family transcriptional regulator [Salipiger mangrovisoli]